MSWFDTWLGPLSEQKFAQRLIELLHQAGDVREATYDAVSFQLRFRHDKRDVGYANLRNLYAEYVNHATRDREPFFRFAVRSLLASHKALPDEFADARSDILATVRHRAYFSLLELRNWVSGNPDFNWPYRPLAEHLGVGLAYDLPEAMVMLQSVQLTEWDVSFYEVYEQALQNLSQIDATFTTIDDHAYASSSGDHYDASRMLLPELISELTVIGDPVVMLPNRDRMLVTGSQDRQGLETVALVAQQLLSHPRPVSGFAFVLREDEWSPWLPDPDHPAYSTLRSTGLRTLQHDYQQQRKLLQVWLAQHQSDVHAAEFRTHGAGVRQPPTSFCVWQQGRPALLPRTDRICFLRTTKRSIIH